ncbi:hypothetical protein D3C81_2015130 [compost metagenome]
MKRSMYRLNSTALCHGWKAKVVAHMYQKFVLKKCGPNQSLIRALPMASSGVMISLPIASRSAISKPIDNTSCTSPLLSTRRALE